MKWDASSINLYHFFFSFGKDVFGHLQKYNTWTCCIYAMATTEILSFGKDEFGQLQKYMDIYICIYIVRCMPRLQKILSSGKDVCLATYKNLHHWFTSQGKLLRLEFIPQITAKYVDTLPSQIVDRLSFYRYIIFLYIQVYSI
jgi:hypothetical protein